eukprot:11171065-Lingulodinium_polyedra.AAC.1
MDSINNMEAAIVARFNNLRDALIDDIVIFIPMDREEARAKFVIKPLSHRTGKTKPPKKKPKR